MQNKFSPSEAATSFFSFFKAHPKFVLRYMAFYAMFILLIMAGMATTGYFDMIGQFMALSQTGKTVSPEKMSAIFSGLNSPIVFGIFLVSIPATIALSTMGLRKTVRNEEIGFYGLIWGKDENQLIISMLQVWLLAFIGFIAVAIGIAISAALKLTLIAVLLSVGFVLFLIFMIGRFGMFGVLTIAKREAGTFASFDYSKQQFWSFVGAFFLNFIIVAIFTGIVQTIIRGIFSPLMSDAINGMPTTEAAFFSIGSLLSFAAMGAVSGATRIAIFCTGAYAYHKIAEGNSTAAPSVEAQ